MSYKNYFLSLSLDSNAKLYNNNNNRPLENNVNVKMFLLSYITAFFLIRYLTLHKNYMYAASFLLYIRLVQIDFTNICMFT